MKTYRVSICDDCLAGKGEECHEPGCLFIRQGLGDPLREVLPQVRDLLSEPVPTSLKCLDCKRALHGQLVDSELLVSTCSHCLAKAAKEAARDADGYAREDAARERDEGRY